jgi:lambda family phage portal protein
MQEVARNEGVKPIQLNRLEKAIGSLSPRWAATRLADRASLEAQRIMLAYGAAYPSIDREHSWGPLVTEEAELQGFSRFQLMLEGRDLYRNFPLIRAAVNGIARRAVASGIHPQLNTQDEGWNHETEKQWRDWSEMCDLSGKLDLDGICRQAIRSTYTDGDLGIGLVTEDKDLRLQVIEGDRIAENMRAGVQIDTFNPIGGVNVDWSTGRPISYLVGKRGMGGILNTDMKEPWPAESFILLFRPQRVDQVRGVPLLAPVIQTARDLDRYITATRIQANIAATFGVVIKRNAAAQFMMRNSTAVPNSSTHRTVPLTTGKMTYLNEGEEIDSFEPKVPAQNFDAFSKFLVRIIAIGMGTTYEALMNDFTNMSFSSSKTHLMDIEMSRNEWQRWLVRNLLFRIYSVWVSKRMESGLIEFNEQAFDAINWQSPAPIYANPVDEASDTSERLRAGTTTFEDVYNEQEAQWKHKLTQRAKEVKFIEDLATEYKVSPDKISNTLPPGVLKPLGTESREQEPAKVEVK